MYTISRLFSIALNLLLQFFDPTKAWQKKTSPCSIEHFGKTILSLDLMIRTKSLSFRVVQRSNLWTLQRLNMCWLWPSFQEENWQSIVFPVSSKSSFLYLCFGILINYISWPFRTLWHKLWLATWVEIF